MRARDSHGDSTPGASLDIWYVSRVLMPAHLHIEIFQYQFLSFYFSFMLQLSNILTF